MDNHEFASFNTRSHASLVFSKARNTVMFENLNSRGDKSFARVVIWSVERLRIYILSSYRTIRTLYRIHGRYKRPIMIDGTIKIESHNGFSRISISAFCETPTTEINEVSDFYFFTVAAPWRIQHNLPYTLSSFISRLSCRRVRCMDNESPHGLSVLAILYEEERHFL